MTSMHKDIQTFIFNERAKSFDKLSWVSNLDFLGNVFTKIFSFVDSEAKVGRHIQRYLDVGTGTGEVLKFLSENYREQNLLLNTVGYGIDISDKMIQKAKEKLNNKKNILLFNRSIYEHDLEYKSFDFIICRNAFHHFNDPDGALTEMRKLVREGGRIYIIEGVAPNNFTLLKWKDVLQLKDLGRNSNVFLSLENIKDFFETNYKLSSVEVTSLTPVIMQLSNWLDNAILTSDSRKEIIHLVSKLNKDDQFRDQFGLSILKKTPEEEKDFEFKKRSALIDILVER